MLIRPSACQPFLACAWLDRSAITGYGGLERLSLIADSQQWHSGSVGSCSSHSHCIICLWMYNHSELCLGLEHVCPGIRSFKREKPPTSVQDNGQLHCVLQGATFLFKTQRGELPQRGALRASSGFLLEQTQPPSIRDKAPPLCPHSSLKETEFRSCLLLLLLTPLFISLIPTEWPCNSLTPLSRTRSMPFSYTPTPTSPISYL